MQVLFEGVLQMIWKALELLLAQFRRAWSDRRGWSTVHPLTAATAAGVLVLALLLGAPAWHFGRLALAFLEDDFLMFIGLLVFVPLALMFVTGALAVLAGGVRAAAAILLGEPSGRAWAWVFSVLGTLQVSMYVWLEWPVLAALTLVATIGEVVLLLGHRPGGAPVPYTEG